MTALRLALACAAASALLALAPYGALAQVGTVGGYLPPPIPGPGSGSLYPNSIPAQPNVGHNMGVFHGGTHRGADGGVFILEDREYVPVIYEHESEAPPAPAAPAPPPERRAPYVIGKSYSSLPGECMKMIQDGTSYYYCDGDWYRQLGNGHNAQYKAVAKP